MDHTAIPRDASRRADDRSVPPVADDHQHLFSPATTDAGRTRPSLSAAELIAVLDAAGMRKGLVLSLAYQCGNPNRPPVDNEYEKVKAENDWTSAQVAAYPDRLYGFCSVNPLKWEIFALATASAWQSSSTCAPR